MAYNPGITNRSGEILAQGIASAAQTRMQGYQNATNTLLKSFTDLNKKQQEEEIKRNEALAKFKSDPDLMAKLGEKGNEDLKARYDRINAPVEGFWAKYAGRGDLEDSDLLYKYATGTQEATNRATAKTMLGFATDDAAARKAAADIAAKEYANLQKFRAGVTDEYNAGVAQLGNYNTFATGQEDAQRRADGAEQTALGNTFISGARNDLGGNSLTSGFGMKPYVPPMVPQFATSIPPSVSTPPPPSGVINPPSQVSGLKMPNRPYGFEGTFEGKTPEQINQMIYDYTPGSNSAQQRIYAMRDVLTPQLMQGENTIQASMDKSSRAQAMAEARLRNSEIRRMETAVRNRKSDAIAAEQLGFSRRADERAEEATKRAIAAAANEPIGTVIKGAAGNQEKERQARMDAEIKASPEALEVLRQLNSRNFVVRKEDRSKFEKYVNNLKLSKEAKTAIIGRFRE